MAVILASQSPRRRELLAQMGLTDFLIRPATGEEVIDPALTPDRLVEELSLQKAREVAAHSAADDLVIAADTVVEAPDGRILGKPADQADASDMLSSLSGKRHYVYSGFTLLWKGGVYTEAVASGVRFKPLTDQEIRSYIATGEPMDKAGSYAIQGLGGALTDGFEGDFTNIVGLPMQALEKAVQELFRKKLSDFTEPLPPTLIR